MGSETWISVDKVLVLGYARVIYNRIPIIDIHVIIMPSIHFPNTNTCLLIFYLLVNCKMN